MAKAKSNKKPQKKAVVKEKSARKEKPAKRSRKNQKAVKVKTAKVQKQSWLSPLIVFLLILFFATIGLAAAAFYYRNIPLIIGCAVVMLILAIIIRIKKNKKLSEIEKQFERSEERIVDEIQEIIKTNHELKKERERLEGEIEKIMKNAWDVGEKEVKSGLIEKGLDVKKPVKRPVVAGNAIRTDIDELYDLICQRGVISLGEAAYHFGSDKKIVEQWGKVLEMNKMITIHFPVIGDLQFKKRDGES